MIKHFTIFVSTLLIASCGYKDSEKITYEQKVDWSNDRTCSVSIDNKFLDSLIQNMTLEQKVGQIIMPDIDEITPQDAKEYQLGTFLMVEESFQIKIKIALLQIGKSLVKIFIMHLQS